MTKMLSEFVNTTGRFSRSANVERDHGGAAIQGYVPTGRALDVISRIAGGLVNPAAGRAFSVTGPHGGGKSSLAVFLDALLSPPATADSKAAREILRSTDDAVAKQVTQGMSAVKAGRGGFIRAFATARKEPVAATVARALFAGAVRQFGPSQNLVPASFNSRHQAPSSIEIRACINELVDKQPVLLVIDEFGKNLEHFVASGDSGDPFLLQELAEMAQGADPARLVIITMQHLSFDEYVQDSASARRREWAKVQGRFQDVPYVETPSQSRRLIASTLEQSAALRTAANSWIGGQLDKLDAAGLRDVAEDAVAAIPLNPITLAVLPDLCSRYGQNERTLFSFMAGSEPLALPAYLAKTSWRPGRPLPLVGLDHVYDYFLEASGNMIGVADSASRWLEIETRIRDTAGLTRFQLKLLKTIGLLNLVSSGGRIRASRGVVQLASNADEDGAELDRTLDSLVQAGLITYRAFSDEFRIWQGSDYNIRKVVDDARHALQSAPLDELLSDALDLEPLVAGRHSQRSGVLRVFGRRFTPGLADDFESFDRAWDGIVCYVTDPAFATRTLRATADGRPAIYAIPKSTSEVFEAALEAAALRAALRTAEQENADWVAQRELGERLSAAQQQVHLAVCRTWEMGADWFLAGNDLVLDSKMGLSAILSEVADIAYPKTPSVSNEMIARRELTSQGAKARRLVIDALLNSHASEAFGIAGYGPERAIYEAIFRKTGLHRQTEAGEWKLEPPTDASWKPVWKLVNSAFDSAILSRVNLSDISDQLVKPPIGIKDGLIPLVLIAVLQSRGHELALYEHGSLVLSLDDAVAERLTKNPGHFAVKNTQARGTSRALVMSSLIDRLGIRSNDGSPPSFLNVATALYRELRLLPPYVQKTRWGLSDHAQRVRDAFHNAMEPDVLIFELLPDVFGFKPFTGKGRVDSSAANVFGDALADAMRELRGSYAALLDWIREQLAGAASAGGDLGQLRKALAADATRLDGHVLEPKLKAFVGALLRPLDDEAWLENVAMVMSEGQAPRVWSDEIRGRFPLLAAELGGALRRTSALLHDRLATTGTGGYSTTRLTLTQPDGTETIEMLTLTEPEKLLVDPHLEELLDRLADSGVQRAVACRMLMARLAGERTPAGDLRADDDAVRGEETRHG